MKDSHDPFACVAEAYFGFGSFRPLQAEIIRDTLAGKDVFAVLPTGGGNPLFSTARAHAAGLDDRISPLIALMKDQWTPCRRRACRPRSSIPRSPRGNRAQRLRGLHKRRVSTALRRAGAAAPAGLSRGS